MRYLFLDDVRMPTDAGNYVYVPHRPMYRLNEWEIVRSYDEFVKWITENGVPDVISFDHDLSEEHYAPEMYHGKEAYDKVSERFKEKTGYDCAKWLVEYLNGKELPECYCHSMNPIGKQNITSYLLAYSASLI